MTLAYPVRKSYFTNNAFLKKTPKLLRKLACAHTALPGLPPSPV